jgi:hypothetical protein
VIIDDLDIHRSVGRPHETNSKLLVDADAVLSRSIVLQRFQAIAGRDTQIVERSRPFQLLQSISAGIARPRVETR